VIPHVIVGRRDGVTWVTLIHRRDEEDLDPRLLLVQKEAVQSSGVISFEEGTQPPTKWQRSVSDAVERIGRGEVDKVVLARDIVATSTKELDTRSILNRLAGRYGECWAFLVDGMIGATPELLVRRRGDMVTSRVLAGTVRRGKDHDTDANLAEALLASDKDQEEHEYAVSSVAQALATHCTDLSVPDEPRLLRLANVQHLATDINGRLADEVPVLSLAASLHPTAAVCGTPTERAAKVISALEGMDRGRYAGPVGWMDSHFDGELGIALRCGEIDGDDPHRIRLFAGCGIVAGSDPVSELAESNAKLEPMRYALGCD
jgi:menaquinone-specific isochorismate synthase